VLRKYASSFPELFNVSEVDIVTVTHNDADYLQTLTVERSPQPKCERCWRSVPDVGQDEKYPTVCLRCAEALDAIDFPPYSAASTN
jgi:isoleucyl-tRNA synthetase